MPDPRLLLVCEHVGLQGGIESYLQVVVPALLRAGCDVRIIARRVDDGDVFGAPCQQIRWSDEHDAPSAEAAQLVRGTIDSFSPDAVAVHSCFDSGVLRATRTAPRLIAHLHDHRAFCPNGDRRYPQGGGICGVKMGGACAVHALVHGCAYGPRARTLQLISRRNKVRFHVTQAQRVIVMSHYMALLAEHNGCDPQRVTIVDPPLAPDAFGQSPPEAPPADRVLFVGRIVPQKGLRSLVRALALIALDRRPQLAVAGDGPELGEALKEARTHGVSVDWLGSLDTAGVRCAIDGARMVAVPSLWGEPFGLVGIEAFARGRPVVAFSGGAIKEWLGKGGELVRRGDEAAMARAIEKLQDDAKWYKAAQSAWLAARRYNSARHVERLMHLYFNPPRHPNPAVPSHPSTVTCLSI